MEPTITKRRHRFRFSLRTTFVTLTILGFFLGFLAMQIKWIHERHEALAWMLPMRARQLAIERGSPLPPQKGEYIGRSGCQAPWILGILGEAGVERIEVYQDWLTPDARYSLIELQSLFPEATVILSSGKRDRNKANSGAAECRINPYSSSKENDK